MDDALLNIVRERLDKVPLPEDSASLLLAACDSDASLAAQLGEPAAPASARSREGERRNAAEPAGAFLRSVTVNGFRGIGAPSTLPVAPGPGLTLVLGRNGSGKSSFAEALEVLLTGDLKRWVDLSAVWREGWRNLHTPAPAEISAELLVEDAGPTTARRMWAADASFVDSRVMVQASGEKQAGIERLGWRDSLVTYRPFLSHTELEVFLRQPSQLFDMLSSVLGLEALTAAAARLATERKQRESGPKEARRNLPSLLEQLEAAEDERAAACRAALSGRHPDLDRALTVTTGVAAAADGEIDRLRLLSQLTAAEEDQVRGVTTVLRQAADRLEATAGSKAGQARALAGLLSAALDHYRVHGAGDCPVCGQAGVLNEQWRIATEQAIERLRGEAAEAEGAQDQANIAHAQARTLLLPAPNTLSGPAIAQVDPQTARVAWKTWASFPDDGPGGLRKLASHMERTWPPLHEAVTALAAQAAAELQAREDRWAPLAAQVAAWCRQAAKADAEAAPVPAIKKAEAWLKKATDDIRNARLAPLAQQARAIWTMLRQESNVDLGAIRLSGSGTRRQADLAVSVDGSASTALGVMSQGEVNALALSIFLPRATLAASPFRFLVIDDPVQAMDPAKVDGLAAVLHEVSKKRQVIVFTHDDRLSEAVRRLEIPADILEVTRRPRSVVEVRLALAPVQRAIEDARALCADKALPCDVAGRVIPGLCRIAVEAAFTAAIRRKQLRAGRRHADVENAIDSADSLNKRAALALCGDPAKGGEVLPHVNRAWGWRAGDTYKALNKAAHIGYQGDLWALITDTEDLTTTISSRLQ